MNFFCSPQLGLFETKGDLGGGGGINLNKGSFSGPEVLSHILDTDKDSSLCRGSFVHVFVNAQSERPVKQLEGQLRSGMERIRGKTT